MASQSLGHNLSSGRVLALEPIGGIAGDMCLAALLHLGDRLERGAALRAALGAGLRALAEAADAHGSGGIDLAQVQLRETAVEVNGIRALHIDVELPPARLAREPHHRAYADIRALLARARLPEGARDRAQRTFAALAEAEGRIHGVPPETIEFHEVGALDAIVDVVGSAILLDQLEQMSGALRVVCLPLPAGSGTVQSAHGTLPLPAPATLELLRGRALRSSGPGERTTPTGAALAATQSAPAEQLPDLTVLAIGYGAGSKRWSDAPNLLRAVLGEAVRGGAQPGEPEPLWQLEANLDDLSPQLLAHALESLLAAGAKDAWIAPLVMKKGRPGHLLAALCAEGAREACERIFFRETSSLGVRAFRVERRALEREIVEVQTPFGAVRVKLGRQAGEVVQAAPEFDDCLAAARAHGAPVKEVQAAALAAWSNRAGPR